MATTMMQMRPAVVTACASSGHRKQNVDDRRGSPSNWWSPIFGWPSEPDYIDSAHKRTVQIQSATDPDPKPAKSKFAPLTEEKARQLRRLTTETASFHDIMYHSAIASRLASDFKDGSSR